MENKITIYTDKIILKKGELTPIAQRQLVALLEAQKQLSDLLEGIKEQLGEQMEKSNLNSVEYGEIKVTRSVTGTRFAFDPDKKVDPAFTQLVSYPKVNTKAVDAYLTLHDKLPKGILESLRKVKVDIKLQENNES